MFDNRVEEHKAIAVGLEWEILELATATVEAHQTTRFAKNAGKLVHDATVDTTVVMFGSLSGKYHIPLADLVVGKEVVQTIGKTAFHSCTRRHTSSEWNIASKGNIEALDVCSTLAHLKGYAVDVACP